MAACRAGLCSFSLFREIAPLSHCMLIPCPPAPPCPRTSTPLLPPPSPPPYAFVPPGNCPRWHLSMMQPHRLKHVPLFTPVAIPLDVRSDDRTAVRRRNSVLANVRRKSILGTVGWHAQLVCIAYCAMDWLWMCAWCHVRLMTPCLRAGVPSSRADKLLTLVSSLPSIPHFLALLLLLCSCTARTRFSCCRHVESQGKWEPASPQLL